MTRKTLIRPRLSVMSSPCQSSQPGCRWITLPSISPAKAMARSSPGMASMTSVPRMSRVLYPAAVVSREHAHGHPDANGDEHGHDADEQGDAGAVHQAGQHVPSELVRTEDESVSGRDGQAVGVQAVGHLQHGVVEMAQSGEDRRGQCQDHQEGHQARRRRRPCGASACAAGRAETPGRFLPTPRRRRVLK